jgi:hypothetical protein
MKQKMSDAMSRQTEPKYAPPLKNPKAFTGPDPTVTISSRFPHILRAISNFADKKALLQLPATSNTVADLVDREFAFHIDVADKVMDLKFTGHHLGGIPVFHFFCPITMGAITPLPTTQTASRPSRLSAACC